MWKEHVNFKLMKRKKKNNEMEKKNTTSKENSINYRTRRHVFLQCFSGAPSLADKLSLALLYFLCLFSLNWGLQGEPARPHPQSQFAHEFEFPSNSLCSSWMKLKSLMFKSLGVGLTKYKIHRSLEM